MSFVSNCPSEKKRGVLRKKAVLVKRAHVVERKKEVVIELKVGTVLGSECGQRGDWTVANEDSPVASLAALLLITLME